jgi:transposase InsO family protein
VPVFFLARAPSRTPTARSSYSIRLRILTVVDDCTRECLALVADTSLSGVRVAREPDRLLIERGKLHRVTNQHDILRTGRHISGQE